MGFNFVCRMYWWARRWIMRVAGRVIVARVECAVFVASGNVLMLRNMFGPEVVVCLRLVLMLNRQ